MGLLTVERHSVVGRFFTAQQLWSGILLSVDSSRPSNLSRPYCMQTDASDCGMGGVLSQVDGDGDERSVKLLLCEEEYSRKGMSVHQAGSGGVLCGQAIYVPSKRTILQWLNYRSVPGKRPWALNPSKLNRGGVGTYPG